MEPGTLLEAGGYSGRREIGGYPVKSDRLVRLENVLNAVRGADALDLRIRIHNRWEPSGPDQGGLVWCVDVTSEPPGHGE